MEIEIWSDVVCPFCYIGKKRFEKALEDLPGRERIKITWRSFELDPRAEKGAAGSIYEKLAKKYGRSIEWAREANASVTQQAKELGLDFRMDKVIPNNTFDAHRLMHFAKNSGFADKLNESLFQAYFTEGLDISDTDVLVELARKSGLDAGETQKVMEDGTYAAEVRADEDTARDFGLQGVPAFIINRKYLISGAQPPEVFRQALEKALQD